MTRILLLVRAALCLLVCLPLLTSSAGAEQGTPLPEAAVDLARVPVDPGAVIEPGFQLVQAGWIELSAVAYALFGDSMPPDAFGTVEAGYTAGFSQVLALLSDRADPFSEPLSQLVTLVLEFDSSATATEAAAEIRDLLELDEPTAVDGIDTWSSPDITEAIVVDGDTVIRVAYIFPEQQFSTRQNTDWTPEAVAALASETQARLLDAREAADAGEAALSRAGLLIQGPDAGWTITWPYLPISQHYRVLDGVALPYGGELDSDLLVPEGMETYYVSRQQLGDDGYDHLLDITLAEFATPADAEAFAAAPPPVQFPPTWSFEPTYGPATEVEPGLWLQSVRVDGDALRATGQRTIRVDDTTVQVMQWLGSEHALTSSEGMLELTAIQTACLRNLPAACAPMNQDLFPAPVDDESAATGSFPDIGTPEPRSGGDNVLASLGYGWEVRLPDDGWEITDVQFLNGEYYLLQSGRSLLSIESAINRAASPQDCLLDEVAMLEEFEDRALITLGSDDPTERKAGLEQGHAWGVYTVEPLQDERADQEYTIRIDCYTLVSGEVSLIVTHTAPRDLWTDERPKGERFREALTLPDPSTVAIATTPSAGDGWVFGRIPAMGTIMRIWTPQAA